MKIKTLPNRNTSTRKMRPDIRRILLVPGPLCERPRMATERVIMSTIQKTGLFVLKRVSKAELLLVFILLNMKRAIKKINSPIKRLPAIFSVLFSTRVLPVKIDNQCVNANSIPIEVLRLRVQNSQDQPFIIRNLPINKDLSNSDRNNSKKGRTGLTTHRVPLERSIPIMIFLPTACPSGTIVVLVLSRCVRVDGCNVFLCVFASPRALRETNSIGNRQFHMENSSLSQFGFKPNFTFGLLNNAFTHGQPKPCAR